MNLLEAIARRLPAPRLTAGRVAAALAVALVCDAIQIALGPVGWFLPDEIIDVIAMIITCWLLGFHVLLLPTFLIEFIPGVGMLPTWTGCVVAVVALRRRAQRAGAVPPVGMATLPAATPPRLADMPPARPERSGTGGEDEANPT